MSSSLPLTDVPPQDSSLQPAPTPRAAGIAGFPENRPASPCTSRRASARAARASICRYHGVWRDTVFLERRRTDDLSPAN
jgi:hypothetical protein